MTWGFILNIIEKTKTKKMTTKYYLHRMNQRQKTNINTETGETNMKKKHERRETVNSEHLKTSSHKT